MCDWLSEWSHQGIRSPAMHRGSHRSQVFPASTWPHRLTVFADPVTIKWRLSLLLACVSLVADEVEGLFTSVWASRVLSSVKDPCPLPIFFSLALSLFLTDF